MMVYNEVDYWGNRKNPNSSDTKTTNKHINFIKNKILGKNKILDFGPGVGRILPAYSDSNDITGFDVSDNYKTIIVNSAIELGLNFKLETNPTYNNILPYSDNTFESVVCVSVLLHQRPQNIIKILKELSRVGDEVNVVSWFEEGKSYDDTNINYNGNKYCFHYDYKKICEENSLTIKEWKLHSDLKQVFFTYGKK